MAEIKLILMSDLCAASGSGYAHTIDTDICYDNDGLPFIPGRRLKGCLRDAALYCGIAPEMIDHIFGVSGSSQPGALFIDNGYLTDYATLKKELHSLKGSEKLSQNDVLSHFTSVRSQTAIDPATGTAKKESLRFTRVMNRWLPYGNNRPAEFVFHVDCPAECNSAMSDLCKALRHMGSGRTRGFGAVSCRFIPTDCQCTTEFSISTNKDGSCTLPLRIHLNTPLLLATVSDAVGKTYIPGSSMLGAIAGLYLKEHAVDDLFADLFLRNKVRYSNLYIIDASGRSCIPAPSWLRKIKSSNETDGQLTTVFTPGNTSGTKVLRAQYVDQELKTVAVNCESTYHHVHSGPDPLLYTQTSISAGQDLVGSITGENELLRIIADLLKRYPLRIGKSRTAQYAGCTAIPAVMENEADEEIHIHPGDTIIFDFVSDVILTDSTGSPVVDPFAVAELLLPDATQDAIDPRTTLNHTLIHGYNSKRNLRNIPVHALAMGSSLVVHSSTDVVLPVQQVIGERNAEGYGSIRVRKAEDLEAIAFSTQSKDNIPQASEPCTICLLTPLIEQKSSRSDALRKGLDLFDAKKAVDMTASFIGRALLMTEQSEDAADMEKRIDSIKDKKKQEWLTTLFSKVKGDRNWKDELIMVLQLTKYSMKKEEKAE